MRFQSPLLHATLLRRYKRFLADIRLGDGTETTAHCPNPGAMTGLAAPGTAIRVERNDDPRRKLRYTWRLVGHDAGHFICVDTGLANRVTGEALRAQAIPSLAIYDTVLPEQRMGDRSRVDFVLRGPGQPAAWIEVKSVTLLRRPGLAEFPDSVTARGARHLAADIDPAYASALAEARASGVEVMGHRADITPEGISIGPALPLASGPCGQTVVDKDKTRQSNEA
jgi:sugar fermentation stimulation protein A